MRRILSALLSLVLILGLMSSCSVATAPAEPTPLLPLTQAISIEEFTFSLPPNCQSATAGRWTTYTIEDVGTFRVTYTAAPLDRTEKGKYTWMQGAFNDMIESSYSGANKAYEETVLLDSPAVRGHFDGHIDNQNSDTSNMDIAILCGGQHAYSIVLNTSYSPADQRQLLDNILATAKLTPSNNPYMLEELFTIHSMDYYLPKWSSAPAANTYYHYPDSGGVASASYASGLPIPTDDTDAYQKLSSAFDGFAESQKNVHDIEYSNATAGDCPAVIGSFSAQYDPDDELISAKYTCAFVQKGDTIYSFVVAGTAYGTDGQKLFLQAVLDRVSFH